MERIGVEINLSKSISSPSRPVFEFAKRTVVDGINVSGISFKQLISATSIGSRVGNILYFSKLGLIRTNTVLAYLLGKWSKVSLKDIRLPSLALLGALFKSGKISLNALAEVMIDPNDDEFDLEESELTLPDQSLLTAEKELLNNKETSFFERRSELNSEL